MTPPIVLIHGLWLTPRSWEGWKARFEEREVKVEQRTESRVVISGIPEGTTIALVDPTAKTQTTSQPSSPSVPPAGGPR